MGGAALATTLHGVFIEIFGLGVLIEGRSGSGKSELALELLARGHRLIADDAAEFTIEGAGVVVGRCPALLQGFLEVRGLGILNVQRMFGDSALLAQCKLDLVLQLQPWDAMRELPDRIYGPRARRCVLGVELSEIALPVRPGHSLAVLAEVACRDQQLKHAGYDAAADFVDRQRAAIAGATI